MELAGSPLGQPQILSSATTPQVSFAATWGLALNFLGGPLAPNRLRLPSPLDSLVPGILFPEVPPSYDHSGNLEAHFCITCKVVLPEMLEC